MPTTTTVAAYRAALFDALKADADIGGSGVQVAYGDPTDKRPECIYLDGAVSADVEEPNMKSGRRRRHEDYEFDVVFVVASKGTPQTNELRAAELVGHVEDILADDVTLSTSVLWAVPTGFEWETDFDGDGGSPRAVVTYTISVKANLA